MPKSYPRFRLAPLGTSSLPSKIQEFFFAMAPVALLSYDSVTFFARPKKVTKEKTPKSNTRDDFPRLCHRFQPSWARILFLAEIGTRVITFSTLRRDFGFLPTQNLRWKAVRPYSMVLCVFASLWQKITSSCKKKGVDCPPRTNIYSFRFSELYLDQLIKRFYFVSIIRCIILLPLYSNREKYTPDANLLALKVAGM